MVLCRDKSELVFVEEADPLPQSDLRERLSMHSHALVKLLGRLGRIHSVVQDGHVVPNDVFPVF